MKIGVLYYGSLFERTGAGKVVRSFYKNESIYQENGIDRVNMYCINQVDTPDNATRSTFQRVKDFVRKYDNQSYLGSVFHIYYHWMRRSDIVVSRYLNSGKQDEDVLVFHEFFTCWSYLKQCQKKNVPIKPYIIILHSNGELWKMEEIYFPKIVGRRMMVTFYEISRQCLERASRIVFVSNTSRETFHSVYPQYQNKTAVVPNGIEDRTVDVVQRSYDALRIVTVGTLNSRKNQVLIIQALKELAQYPISATFVGGGEKKEEYEATAQELGVADRAHFLGSRGDVEAILADHNLFVMSSLDEGLPIAGIEALRSGLPLVITNVGGNRELIRDNGFLIEPDIDEMCNAILFFLEDKKGAIQMGNNSYKLFREKYTSEKMVEGYSKLVYEVINEHSEN